MICLATSGTIAFPNTFNLLDLSSLLGTPSSTLRAQVRAATSGHCSFHASRHLEVDPCEVWFSSCDPPRLVTCNRVKLELAAFLPHRSGSGRHDAHLVVSVSILSFLPVCPY